MYQCNGLGGIPSEFGKSHINVSHFECILMPFHILVTPTEYIAAKKSKAPNSSDRPRQGEHFYE